MFHAPAIAIIPARLGSTRFPGKVLADETGKPLIQHVAEAAARSSRIARVVIATDDQRVRDRVAQFGGECVMTSPDHPNGTSRLAEAAAALGLAADQLIINVQGDEPELDPALIDSAVDALRAAGAGPASPLISTIAAPLSPEAARDPNVVKVVRRADGRALYFSRSIIPHDRDATGGVTYLRHVGLYVYRRDFLDTYRSLAPTPLEQAEKLEQLRALEHGYDIIVALSDYPDPAPGIDTPEQYAAFVRRYRSRQR